MRKCLFYRQLGDATPILEWEHCSMRQPSDACHAKKKLPQAETMRIIDESQGPKKPNCSRNLLATLKLEEVDSMLLSWSLVTRWQVPETAGCERQCPFLSSGRLFLMCVQPQGSSTTSDAEILARNRQGQKWNLGKKHAWASFFA